MNSSERCNLYMKLLFYFLEAIIGKTSLKIAVPEFKKKYNQSEVSDYTLILVKSSENNCEKVQF